MYLTFLLKLLGSLFGVEMHCLWTTSLIQSFHSTLIPFWGLPHLGVWGVSLLVSKVAFAVTLKPCGQSMSPYVQLTTATTAATWLEPVLFLAPPKTTHIQDTGSHRQNMHDQRTTYIRSTRQRDTDPQGHIEEAAVGMAMVISSPTTDHGHSPDCDHPIHSGPNRRPAQQDTSFLIELYCGI